MQCSCINNFSNVSHQRQAYLDCLAEVSCLSPTHYCCADLSFTRFSNKSELPR